MRNKKKETPNIRRKKGRPNKDKKDRLPKSATPNTEANIDMTFIDEIGKVIFKFHKRCYLPLETSEIL